MAAVLVAEPLRLSLLPSIECMSVLVLEEIFKFLLSIPDRFAYYDFVPLLFFLWTIIMFIKPPYAPYACYMLY